MKKVAVLIFLLFLLSVSCSVNRDRIVPPLWLQGTWRNSEGDSVWYFSPKNAALDSLGFKTYYDSIAVSDETMVNAYTIETPVQVLQFMLMSPDHFKLTSVRYGIETDTDDFFKE